ncbi:MAG: methyltransferase domain-containing protein [Patescibacteria group bacterium]
MQVHASTSEDNGISVLTDDDLSVYSVGISTWGVAEIRMVQANPKRHIIATTIDEEGAEFAKKHIAKNKLEQQIEVKLEDVSQPLAYQDNTFDYVYARLVLHYLPKQELISALAELYRVLKPGGKLFVVVRSTKCSAVMQSDAKFDPVTNFTTYMYKGGSADKHSTTSRFFHTEDSISQYVTDAGFKVSYTKSYDEDLYADFMRTVKVPELNNVIELLTVK